MMPWVELYGAHRALRARGREVVTGLRQVLRALGEDHPSVFDAHVHQRLQRAKNTRGNIQIFRLGADGGEKIATQNLAEMDQHRFHLLEAHLTVLLSLEAASGHLRELTLMVEGKRHDGTPWTIAIHLPDDRVTNRNPHADRQGLGAGGHAALHCHVGPTLDHQPKVRVPLPALPPEVLLSWLISQVVPTLPYEPAPWPDVLAALPKIEN